MNTTSNISFQTSEIFKIGFLDLENLDLVILHSIIQQQMATAFEIILAAILEIAFKIASEMYENLKTESLSPKKYFVILNDHI